MSSRFVPLSLFVLVLALMSLYGAKGAQAADPKSLLGVARDTHTTSQHKRHRAIKDLYDGRAHHFHSNQHQSPNAQTHMRAGKTASKEMMGWGWQNKVGKCGKGSDPKCSWGQEITASITPRESRAVHQQKFSAGRVNHRDSVRVYNQRHGHGSVGGKVKAILKDPMAGLADLQMNHGLD
ncbi:hypothetical protein BDZ90DRAFT_277613 [Jaminaea rosea]|uniref:Uncharacterized protein n=1 Tax=Jaminaea rosea TaxID=1569628 RepID=A0A316UYC7_9BASI|nr:hypothetical protein BDZ90DRAFT_277613 [Jaminaea rosea]PWN29311.1 hypothetical protein BDZ90DRAFT_277613 [Jaminaea rosea]